VAKLLDELQPSGPIRPTDFKFKSGRPPRFKTAKELAEFAAGEVIQELFHSSPLTEDQKAMLVRVEYPTGRAPKYFLESLARVERDLYAMSDVRRDLELKTPKGAGEGKHSQAKVRT